MSLNHKRQAFGPYCPSGGDWYSCGYGSHFVGCCGSQPCDNDCPAGNLEPASFDTSYYGQFPDQQCPAGSQWYTCTGTTPAFMGCCKSNPCQQNGCPTGDLTPGFLSSNPAVAAAFSPSGESSPAASSTQSPTAVTAASKSAPFRAIAGGVAGGVVVLAIIIALFIYYRRHAAKSRRARNDVVNRRLSSPTAAVIVGDPKLTPLPGKFSYHTSLLSSPNGAPDIFADSSLPAYSTPAPTYHSSALYHPARYNPDDPAINPAFELPAGFVPYSGNMNGKPAWLTQSITRKSLQYRLSELSGESTQAPVELESPQSPP